MLNAIHFEVFYNFNSPLKIIYLRNLQAVMNALRLLTRTLLRSSTLSFASKKEGKNLIFLK